MMSGCNVRAVVESPAAVSRSESREGLVAARRPAFQTARVYTVSFPFSGWCTVKPIALRRAEPDPLIYTQH